MVEYPPTGTPFATTALTNGALRRFSYYNTTDWALHSYWASWETNNDYKPDDWGGYYYIDHDSNIDTYNPNTETPDAGDYFGCTTLSESRFLIFSADVLEIFSYAAQARFGPLGVQPTMNAFTTFNLYGSPLNYDEQHYSHSRQFRSNIIDEAAYWQKLFDDCLFE